MIHVSISGSLPKSVNSAEIRRTLTEVVRAKRRVITGEISVVFVSDTKMRLLNRRWRKIDRTTDVLSFATSVQPAAALLPLYWGDLFISPVQVRIEAKRRGISLKEEFLRVLAHGMLHLLGYDHATAKEEIIMFRFQERIVARILDI